MNQKIIDTLSLQDEVLKEIIHKVDLPEIKSTHHLFHDLMSCLIEQQIHYRSSKKVFHKLLIKSELDILTVGNFDLFDERALASVKLSRQKIESVVQTLQFFQEKQLDWENMKDEEIRERLTTIKGIGENTVDLILLYTFERENIFPINDYHIKKLMKQLYGLDDKQLKKNMHTIAEKWIPYQSIATRYLLAWKTYNSK